MSEEDKIEDFACVEESPKRGKKKYYLINQYNFLYVLAATMNFFENSS